MKAKFLNYSTLALISGIVSVFSFAPYHIYPLALIGLIGLLTSLIYSESNKQAAKRGFLFGLGLFGVGMYWIYISVYQFGQAPFLIAALLTILLIMLLASIPALAGYCLTRFYPNNTIIKFCLAFPAIWALSEWVRNWLFSGLPWLLMGSSQTNHLFKGIAPVGGVIMISFLLAHFAGVCVYAALSINRKRIFSAVYLISCVIALLYLSSIQWTKPVGDSIKTSLVQANISQSLKWDAGQAQNTMVKYQELSEPLWHDNQLIIWPEAAVPVAMPFSAPLVTGLDKIAKQNNSALIFGVPFQTTDGTSTYNAALGIGNIQGDYYKRHLVPFGEFFPAKAFSKIILKSLDIPMSDFTAGESLQVPMVMGDVRFSTFICYEIIFPEAVGNTVSATGANVIVALSDDAWFGHSPAQAQQLQMAQMRAMETGRYVLSSTNNGLTAVINQSGKIIAQAKPYETAVLTAEVQPMEGTNPWLRWGIDIILLLSLICLFMGKKLEGRFPRLT